MRLPLRPIIRAFGLRCASFVVLASAQPHGFVRR
eukprot:SAG31_NODE_26571_length_440_cov_0.741935_1_plen_33_part_10